MIIGARSDVGQVRTINEDNYYVSEIEDFKLYIVADGMGGHNAGEVASQMAIEIIVESMYEDRFKLNSEEDIFKSIKESIEEANTNIYLKSKSMESCEGMGTTLTLAYIYGGFIYIGHVGDSRAYIVEDKDIRQITRDHSFVDELLKHGDITEDEARVHPKKNLITRAVGSSSILEVDLFKEEYRYGEKLLLLTDGVANKLTNKEIMDIINQADNMEKACEHIIERANELGGEDNSTILAIEFK